MKEGVNPNKEKLLLILGRHLDLLWTESAIPGSYLPYDIVHEIQPNDWPTMTSEIVSGQLLAVINGINQFQTEINSLDAWARVLPDLSEAEAGSFTISHISSVGFFCLNQPYALKERIIHAATQIIHQGNRRTDRTYLDQLLTDTKSLAKFVWPKSSDKLKALAGC